MRTRQRRRVLRAAAEAKRLVTRTRGRAVLAPRPATLPAPVTSAPAPAFSDAALAGREDASFWSARDEHARRLASLCASLATGLEVWSKHAADAAGDARAPAVELRAIVEDALRVAQASRPGVRTCERLRWEWLLSTGTLLDGAPAARFRDECLRLLAEACDHAAHVSTSFVVALERARASLLASLPGAARPSGEAVFSSV